MIFIGGFTNMDRESKGLQVQMIKDFPKELTYGHNIDKRYTFLEVSEIHIANRCGKLELKFTGETEGVGRANFIHDLSLFDHVIIRRDESKQGK